MKVVIVGAGVMGMMQARELAQKGMDVVLIDKGVCGSEASWAGGGIVSPLYPWRYEDPITTLASWSQAYYPNLIQSLEAESNIDPQLTHHGLLMLDVEDRDTALSWSESRQPLWIENVNSEQIYQLEPNLRPGFDAALWMPHICSVRNPRLLSALCAILEHEDRVTLLEKSAVTSIEYLGQKVSGVKTVRGDLVTGDRFIFSSGAWTTELLNACLPDNPVEVAPVKGQMILFAAEPGVVSRVVLSHGKYVIPRRDGRVVAGSTLEYTGFDKATTRSAQDELADMAIDMFPALAKFNIEQHWSGLRPGAPKGLPYIGQMPDFDNLYVNAGHFRNGLVLAPASVALMTSIICQESPPFDPEPYRPVSRTQSSVPEVV